MSGETKSQGLPLSDLMRELLENTSRDLPVQFTDRGREIIDEISDYAEQSRIFQEHKERGKIFDDSTVDIVFMYLLDRVANAPTSLHRDMSVLLIMPFVRQKLREDTR